MMLAYDAASASQLHSTWPSLDVIDPLVSTCVQNGTVFGVRCDGRRRTPSEAIRHSGIACARCASRFRNMPWHSSIRTLDAFPI